eukprot:scaffold6798_cov108-Isochrysis_galbana.AAC.8
MEVGLIYTHRPPSPAPPQHRKGEGGVKAGAKAGATALEGVVVVVVVEGVGGNPARPGCAESAPAPPSPTAVPNRDRHRIRGWALQSARRRARGGPLPGQLDGRMMRGGAPAQGEA